MIVVRPHAPAAALFGAVSTRLAIGMEAVQAVAPTIPATHLFYPVRNAGRAPLIH